MALDKKNKQNLCGIICYTQSLTWIAVIPNSRMSSALNLLYHDRLLSLNVMLQKKRKLESNTYLKLY